MTNLNTKPKVNPMIVLREEFDDWVLLFNPDTNDIFTIDPVSAFIWKRLDGKHSVQEIVKALRKKCDDMPKDAPEQINKFIEELVKGGLVSYENKN